MRHIISIEDLELFEHKSLLASSSNELKRLEIISHIYEGKLKSNFLVTQRDKEKQKEFLFYEVSDNLEKAIQWYNELR